MSIHEIIELVVGAVVVFTAGGYVEYKYGAKIAADVASIEARVNALESTSTTSAPVAAASVTAATPVAAKA